MGRILCAGLGPGDPDLMSVRSDRAIRAATHVAYFRKKGRPGQARRIVEGMAIAIIQIAFRPGAFRQQQPMRFQFQVEVTHAPAPGFLDDACAIHQMLGRDQMAIHFHGVIRADPQVPRRHAGGDRAGLAAQHRPADRCHDD